MVTPIRHRLRHAIAHTSLARRPPIPLVLVLVSWVVLLLEPCPPLHRGPCQLSRSKGANVKRAGGSKGSEDVDYGAVIGSSGLGRYSNAPMSTVPWMMRLIPA